MKHCCANRTPVIDEVNGETVCSKCGVVFDSNMLSMTRQQLNDTITGDVIHAGRSTMPVAKLAKLKRVNSMVVGKDSSIVKMRDTVMSICMKSGLSDIVVKTALNILSKHRHGFPRKSFADCAAASIYVACRQLGITRSMKEICVIATSDIKGCKRVYKTICFAGEDIPNQTTTGFVTRFASDLGLSEIVVRKALHVLDECDSLGISVGKNPVLMASYVIYASSRDIVEPPTQNQIAQIADITGVGMRNIRAAHAKALQLSTGVKNV